MKKPEPTWEMVSAVDHTQGEGPSDLTIGAPWACWGVSWPHHSHQSDQWLWQRGFIKGLGGRGQQPDVTLRFPSSACLREGHLIATVEVRHLQPDSISNIQQTLDCNSHQHTVCLFLPFFLSFFLSFFSQCHIYTLDIVDRPLNQDILWGVLY